MALLGFAVGSRLGGWTSLPDYVFLHTVAKVCDLREDWRKYLFSITLPRQGTQRICDVTNDQSAFAGKFGDGQMSHAFDQLKSAGFDQLDALLD